MPKLFPKCKSRRSEHPIPYRKNFNAHCLPALCLCSWRVEVAAYCSVLLMVITSDISVRTEKGCYISYINLRLIHAHGKIDTKDYIPVH